MRWELESRNMIGTNQIDFTKLSAVARLIGYPMTVIARIEKHETENGLIIAEREQHGVRIVTVRGRKVNIRAIQSANRMRKGGGS